VTTSKTNLHRNTRYKKRKELPEEDLQINEFIQSIEIITQRIERVSVTGMLDEILLAYIDYFYQRAGLCVALLKT
jgi:hypothetical protein